MIIITKRYKHVFNKQILTRVPLPRALLQLVNVHLEQNDASDVMVRFYRVRRQSKIEYSGRYHWDASPPKITVRCANEVFPSKPSKDCHGNKTPEFKDLDEKFYWLFLHEFCHYLQYRWARSKGRLGDFDKAECKLNEKEANEYATKHYRS